MDKSTIISNTINRSERFRTPLSSEREIGLWVDRIGFGTSRFYRANNLRILGLYAAVHVEKGDGFFFSNKTGKVSVGATGIMLIFPNVPHVYYPRKEWQTKWIVWNGPDANMLERLGYLNSNRPIIIGNRVTYTQAFNELSSIMEKEDLTSILARKNIVQNMILEFHKYSKRDKANHHTDSIIQKAIRKINHSDNKNISVSELARSCNLSVTHFRRLFGGCTGRSPKEFMNSLKISKAKTLISEGKSIKETAEMLGFRDVFYFMRFFKKTTGTSAGKFYSLQ